MENIKIEIASLEKIEVLQKLCIQTFTETFGNDNTKEQLQEYFDKSYNLSVLKSDIESKESDTYFILLNNKEVGYLKVNWGNEQTEKKLESGFEIQRIYILKEYQSRGLGKKLFEFSLEKAKESNCEWVWLGVWEKNYKAQNFYKKFGFEKFSEHIFAVGDKKDCDWLLRKKLK
jgi:ribosomal protein S18 acetylase RimI-like enzyme